jgi:Flp pilus assembly protein TadG
MGGTTDSARGDRGSLSIFVVIFSMAVLFLTALLVDLGNVMSAKERAADVAEQAARAAADDLSLPGLRGGAIVIDQGTACAKAQQVVSAYAAGDRINAAITGPGCLFPNPAKVTVTVTVTTTPTILAAFGTFHMTASESACAETAQGVAC